MNNNNYSSKQTLRIAGATLVGTSIEWYDFLLYASAASLIFSDLFFSPLGEGGARIVSYLSIGISYIFRPLGGIIVGHFGDKIGRRPMLVITLIMMGAATALIGCVPSYASIGIAAPIIVLLLRVFQGLSAGGEWGAAAMMAVEHAPKGKRGVYGSFPQIGAPVGLFLSSAVLAIIRKFIAPGEAFEQWGWRLSFLLSILLVFIGAWVRAKVEESPVFHEMRESAKKTPRVPLGVLIKGYFPALILSAMLLAGCQSSGQLITGGFIQGYGKSYLGFDTSIVLWFVVIAGITWAFFTFFAAWLSDKIGRKKVFVIGFAVQAILLVIYFPLVNSATHTTFLTALIMLSFATGMTYGAISCWYAEIFPASIRVTGVSVAYALGAVIGGAFSPTIYESLLQHFGNTTYVFVYCFVFALVSLGCTLLLRDRPGIDLSIDNEEEQENGIYTWQKVS